MGIEVLEVGSADGLIDLKDLVRWLIDSHTDESNFSVFEIAELATTQLHQF